MSRNLATSLGAAVLAAAALLAAGTAAAQYTGPGARATLTSVQAVLDQPVDDQPVRLQGRLVRQLSSDKYLFSDGQADIRVEIKSRLLAAQPVSETTRVEIAGEVDRHRRQGAEIEVDALRVLN